MVKNVKHYYLQLQIMKRIKPFDDFYENQIKIDDLIYTFFIVKGNKNIVIEMKNDQRDLVGRFEFIKREDETWADDDVDIFEKQLQRRGIYTHLLNILEKKYDIKIHPSKFLTRSNKKFWKKRLSTPDV